jgi:hypothetical protein
MKRNAESNHASWRRPLQLARLMLLVGLLVLLPTTSAAAAPRVLRVGQFQGRKGQFRTIQAAVDAARPGNWILVAPGDYHERGDRVHRPGPAPPAGVLISKAHVHLRGMNRNSVIVDGTKPGSSRCSRKPGAQDFGVVSEGHAMGRNGVVAYKANGVSIENLTVCNFLGGSDGNGNEIWWNGGDGSGKIGMGAFEGAYLNATSTFYQGEDTAATYGIFTSNARGPGTWTQAYASNFNDAGFYEGACRQECNLTMRKAWAQFSALGYSGTNSGGKVVVKESEFDHNRDGFDTNSQNNDDAPSPQDGSCPNGKRSPITHSISCWVFMNNYVHDNNNPNTPGSGTAGGSPVGTGVSISGGRFDTVMNNRIEHNGAWGLLLVPFPATETPPPVAHCEGGVETGALGYGCLYDDWGNQVFENRFAKNGFFGNPTNADIGEIQYFGGNPINCFRGNRLPDGSSPTTLAETNTMCGSIGSGDLNEPLIAQVECNTQILGSRACPPGTSYPQKTKVKMHALPKATKLPTMPDPCAGVPQNPWCPRRRGH